tara:strand:- start:712 stop:1020 length:309 start_codon:yes stop_codon:yes gene_type:complete
MIEKIKKNYLPLVGTFLFLYFFFNLLDGERGLISLVKKENLLNQLKLDEKILKEKVEKLELNNSLLTNNIDKDYIEILIRDKFMYSKNGEKIFVLKNNEKPE